MATSRRYRTVFPVSGERVFDDQRSNALAANVGRQFDLNQNDVEALLRYFQTHKPGSGDAREDQRLEDALDALEQALLAANASR